MSENTTPQIADDLRPHLDTIADRLLSRHAAVMVGAGFSRNAVPPGSDTAFPNWSQLGDRFYERLHGCKPEPRSGCFKGARTDREENIVESTDDPTSVRRPPRPSSPPRQGRCEALGARSPRSPACLSLELLEEERNHATCTQQRDTKLLPA